MGQFKMPYIVSKTVIYTDLDGTLLDDRYSFEAALPALSLVREKGIPLVLCSSKTRAEIEYYRGLLGNRDPFISENGGGIFIPDGYFNLEYEISNFELYGDKQYYLIRLGARYEDLRKALNELKADGFDIRGFGDMSVEEVAELTGLAIGEAKMSKERDFDEPFIFRGDENNAEKLFNSLKTRGINFTRGRFHHILGDSDKGRAVFMLNGLYRKKFDGVTTVAIGDSPNDIPMLMNVDLPVIVKKPGGGYDPSIDMPNLVRASRIGPDGWNEFVLDFLHDPYKV